MIQDGIRQTSDEIRSFLLIGQSNMAGRGDIGDVAPIDNPMCLMLRMGRWQRMSEPINPDRAIFEGRFRSGVNLGASFADSVASYTGGRVGLIPCADGGTRISLWMPGEPLYDHAVMMARLAMRTSRLSGILWHQGESDCHTDLELTEHRAKFKEMISRLREDLGAQELPLLIGELSEKIDPSWNVGDRPAAMNRQYRELARELPHTAIVPSQGLALKEDGVHFSAASLREFGVRYFDAWRTLL